MSYFIPFPQLRENWHGSWNWFGFIGVSRLEMVDLNMRPKTNNFIADFLLESGYDGQRKDHNDDAEGDGDHGYTNDRPSQSVGLISVDQAPGNK